MVRVGLGIQARYASKLSVNDSRPEVRGEIGFRLNLDAQVSDRWITSASGHWANTSFNFDGPGVSGNLSERSWSVQVSGLRRLGGGNTFAYIGPGVLYGREDSQVENLVATIDGPKATVWAGTLRGGAHWRLNGRLGLNLEVMQALGLASARDDAIGNEYGWLSPSTAVSAGLAWTVRVPK
jgi:hypothetical protein